MKPGALSRVILGLTLLAFGLAKASNLAHSLEVSSQRPRKKDPRQCDCFTVAGPDPGYFQHYKLWDFRSVPLDKWAHSVNSDAEDDKVGESTDWNDEDGDGSDVDEDEDDHVSDLNDNDDGPYAASPPADALWFFETAFEKDWISQKWQRPRTPQAPVTMVNSKHNVFFTRN